MEEENKVLDNSELNNSNLNDLADKGLKWGSISKFYLMGVQFIKMLIIWVRQVIEGGAHSQMEHMFLCTMPFTSYTWLWHIDIKDTNKSN